MDTITYGVRLAVGQILKRGSVSFDEGPSFPCYLGERTWNGWACPFFTPDIAAAVVAMLNEETMVEGRKDWSFHEESGCYVQDTEDGPCLISSAECETVDGQAWLHPIGAGEYCWNVDEVAK